MSTTDISWPRRVSLNPAAESATGYASNVSGTAFTLTRNTATDGLAHQVSLHNDSANDKSAINVTFVGKDADGNPLTETIAGPGGSATVETAGYFGYLTSVTPASTFGADTQDIGWVDEIATPIFNLNYLAEDVVTLNIDVSGTINYTIQQTFNKFDDQATYSAPSQQVQWQTLISGQTADAVFQSSPGVIGLRIIVNSYSTNATIKADVNPTRLALAGTVPGSGGQSGFVVQGPFNYGSVTADGLIKTGATTLHTVTVSPTGSVTAGVLTIYDNTSESAPIVEVFSLPSTTFTPFSVTFDAKLNTGIYVGFDATLANVRCTVTYL